MLRDCDLPERPLEPRGSKGLACDGCGCTLYTGRRYTYWPALDENLCDECAASAARDELDESGFRFHADRLADVLGFDVEVA